MKEKIKKYTKEFILFFIVMTIFANALSLYRSQDVNNAPLSISTINILNNQSFTLDKSKPILVHFWATWCPTCKAEASNIQTISDNFQVLTIALKSGTDEEIQNYLNDNNLNYKVVNDRDGSIVSKYDVSIFPTTIIYDKNQEVVFSDVGYTSTWGLWLRMLYARF